MHFKGQSCLRLWLIVKLYHRLKPLAANEIGCREKRLCVSFCDIIHSGYNPRPFPGLVSARGVSYNPRT